MTIYVWRYYNGVTDALRKTDKIDGKEITYNEWSQCCTMAWLQGITYSTQKEIAEAMADHDNGYVATFLCSINVNHKTYNESQTTADKLLTLGFKKLVTVPGPEKTYGGHGVDMEIWMYSMVEHGTYRKMAAAMKKFIDPPVPDSTQITSGTVFNNIPMVVEYK